MNFFLLPPVNDDDILQQMARAVGVFQIKKLDVFF